MIGIIAFRTVCERNSFRNKEGKSLIEIECRMGQKRIYFSTHIYVCKDEEWNNGRVDIPGNETLSRNINMAIRELRTRIENIYYRSYSSGMDITSMQLKEMVKNNESKDALLEEFGRMAVADSDRKEATQRSYETLFNDIRKFRSGVLISDVDYNFIRSYDAYMKESGIMDNTRIGRLHQLRALMNEAVKRDVIPSNPFKRFKIPTMTNKKGFLSKDEVKKVAGVDVRGLEKTARDAFLVGCYSGLRFSDIKSLCSSDISDGWIKKKMKKTGFECIIPVKDTFDGKFFEVVERYGGDISRLSKKIGENGQLNAALKKVFNKAGIGDKGFTFHTSRHTFASNLLIDGYSLTSIQKMLGHTKISTSQVYAEVTKDVIMNDMKNVKKKRTRKSAISCE